MSTPDTPPAYRDLPSPPREIPARQTGHGSPGEQLREFQSDLAHGFTASVQQNLENEVADKAKLVQEFRQNPASTVAHVAENLIDKAAALTEPHTWKHNLEAVKSYAENTFEALRNGDARALGAQAAVAIMTVEHKASGLIDPHTPQPRHTTGKAEAAVSAPATPARPAGSDGLGFFEDPEWKAFYLDDAQKLPPGKGQLPLDRPASPGGSAVPALATAGAAMAIGASGIVGHDIHERRRTSDLLNAYNVFTASAGSRDDRARRLLETVEAYPELNRVLTFYEHVRASHTDHGKIDAAGQYALARIAQHTQLMILEGRISEATTGGPETDALTKTAAPERSP